MDVAEATGINSVTGKFRSSNTCNILLPTNPVAPITAILIRTDCVYALADNAVYDVANLINQIHNLRIII